MLLLGLAGLRGGSGQQPAEEGEGRHHQHRRHHRELLKRIHADRRRQRGQPRADPKTHAPEAVQPGQDRPAQVALHLDSLRVHGHVEGPARQPQHEQREQQGDEAVRQPRQHQRGRKKREADPHHRSASETVHRCAGQPRPDH